MLFPRTSGFTAQAPQGQDFLVKMQVLGFIPNPGVRLHTEPRPGVTFTDPEVGGSLSEDLRFWLQALDSPCALPTLPSSLTYQCRGVDYGRNTPGRGRQPSPLGSVSLPAQVRDQCEPPSFPPPGATAVESLRATPTTPGPRFPSLPCSLSSPLTPHPLSGSHLRATGCEAVKTGSRPKLPGRASSPCPASSLPPLRTRPPSPCVLLCPDPRPPTPPLRGLPCGPLIQFILPAPLTTNEPSQPHIPQPQPRSPARRAWRGGSQMGLTATLLVFVIKEFQSPSPSKCSSFGPYSFQLRPDAKMDLAPGVNVSPIQFLPLRPPPPPSQGQLAPQRTWTSWSPKSVQLPQAQARPWVSESRRVCLATEQG